MKMKCVMVMKYMDWVIHDAIQLNLVVVGQWGHLSVMLPMLDVLDELMTKDEEEVVNEVTLKLNRVDLTLTWMQQLQVQHPQV